MYITLTCNPALDHTLILDRLEPGAINRVPESDLTPAGKGINVSVSLYQLNCATRAYFFAGGSTGHLLADLLNKLGLPFSLFSAHGETRINTKVMERGIGRFTDLNLPGAQIRPVAWEALKTELAQILNPNHTLILSGSLPPGLPEDAYAQLIYLAAKAGAPSVLDCSGSAFSAGVQAGPVLVKPNRDELATWIGHSLVTEEALWNAARQLGSLVPYVLLTLGKQGSVALTPAGEFRCSTPEVEVRGEAGAGDAFLGGFLSALPQRFLTAALPGSSEPAFPGEAEIKRALSMACGTAAGAVSLPGTQMPDRAAAVRLGKLVQIEKVSDHRSYKK